MTVTGTFSVIIPCYNYARYLEGCVQSVLSQAEVDVEVLVIDDCSTDDTPAVAASITTDSRVEFWRHEHNAGHIATYNEGLAWATGDYTVVLSADDLLAPGALARAAGVLDAMPDVGMVYGRAPWFDTEVPEPRERRMRAQIWKGTDWIAERCKTARNTIASPEVVVRTSLYKRLGGYRPELPHAADLELWLRIAAHADVAYLRGVDQAYYRVHSLSMSRTQHRSSLIDLRQRKASFDILFDNYGHRLNDATILREQVDRALAREALWRACRAFDRRRLDFVSVEDLEVFARSLSTNVTRLREYRGLGLRRRLGPKWSPWAQFGLPSVYLHRASEWFWWRRAFATGV